MSFESDTSSECSYLFSPDENGTSSTEESSNSGTRGFSSNRDVRKRRRLSGRYHGSDKEGEEEAEGRGKSNFAEESKDGCGRGNERSEFDRGELHSFIDALNDSIAVDERFPNSSQFDIGEFDLSLLDREAVRSETYSTFIDGVCTICSEKTHCAKERVKQVKQVP